jgi:hypothetical protein
VVADRNRQLSNMYVIQKLECKINGVLCRNVHCNLSAVDDYSVNIAHRQHKCDSLNFMELEILFIKTKNNNGPRIDP